MKIGILFVLFLLVFLPLFSTVERELVVVEIGTGTWCQYCPGAAMGADDLIANDHNVAIIENHNGDSYANNYSNHRNNYYNVSAYPTAIFDGTLIVEGGSNTNSMYSSYLIRYEARIDNPSAYTIDIYPYFDGVNCDVEIVVSKVDEYDGNDITLQLTLTESEIQEYWQGQDHLNFVNRLMIPDQFGTEVDLEVGETSNYFMNFTVNAGWDSEHCELVAFLQDETSKEILQGSKIDLIPVINPISPLEIDFGEVEVGSSATENLVVTNYWNEVLTGSVFTINNFEVQNAFTVPIFESIEIPITFVPTANTDYFGAIIFMTSNMDFPAVAVTVSGSGIGTAINQDDISSNKMKLLGNSPNPFNPETEIHYQLNNISEPVELKIYDLKGKLVKTFTSLTITDHTGSVIWNGKDNQEKEVPSGIYYYGFSSKGDLKMKKMLLLK